MRRQDIQPLDELEAYCIATRDRWKELVSNEPADSPSRFPHGYYEMGFALVGAEPVNSFGEVERRLNVARMIKLSGWAPFLNLNSLREWMPYPHNGFVEAWVGRPSLTGGRPTDPLTCDFWRVSRDGKLYTIRGYFEDSPRSYQNNPGRLFSLTSSILRIGEGLLFASRFAETFGEVDQIAIYCRFTGLKERGLTNMYRDQFMPGIFFCSHTDEVTVKAHITQQQVRDNLAEIIHTLMSPLYEHFVSSNLKFDLKLDLVRAELERMQNNPC